MLQVDAALIDALHDRGLPYRASRPTARSPCRARIDWICVSPKAGADLVSDARRRIEARFSAGGPQAGGRGCPPLRASLPAADGRAGAGGQHGSGDRLLQGASRVAALGANPQGDGDQVGSGQWCAGGYCLLLLPEPLAIAAKIPYVTAHAHLQRIPLRGRPLPAVRAAPGSANARVHGHSFRVRVVVDGEPDAETGYIVHFDELSAAISRMRATSSIIVF